MAYNKKIFLLSAALLFSVFFLSFTVYSQPVSNNSLIFGTYKLKRVIDGDTFKFDSLKQSVRLLCIDTEETFKSDSAEEQTKQIEADFDSFYLLQKGESKYPVKTDSPLGYEAWKWAEDFLKGVEYVRLEKDDDTRNVDGYGRLLAYVMFTKDGKEMNYNVECVRYGYSPYFNKYGNSKRFHKEFVEAQEYAKANKLGIWNPDKKHYPDYDIRLDWWNKRARQLEDISLKHSNDPSYINLADQNDYTKLDSNIGKDVIIFGSVGEILQNKFPYLITLPMDKDRRVELVVFENNQSLMKEIDWDELKEYYIYVSGKLESYKGRYQVKLTDKSQVWME